MCVKANEFIVIIITPQSYFPYLLLVAPLQPHHNTHAMSYVLCGKCRSKPEVATIGLPCLLHFL